MASSLLACRDLRVDSAGAPVCDGLSVASSGERVLVLGAPRALFAAVVGLAPVRRGTLTVHGRAPGEAVRSGLIAGAAHEPPLPPRWTVTEYVRFSARLAEAPGAERRAAEAIGALELGALASTALGKLVPHARRAVVVAAALATGAGTIVLEDPVSGLPDDAAATLARLVTAALAGRSWLVLAPRAPLGLALTGAADEAIVLGGLDRVDAQGPPAALAAASGRYVLRLDGAVAPLAAAIAEQGGELQLHGAHAVVELGPTLTTAGLFGLCAAADVTVLELVPALQAFA